MKLCVNDIDLNYLDYTPLIKIVNDLMNNITVSLRRVNLIPVVYDENSVFHNMTANPWYKRKNTVP